jgi:hypothetical protein
MKLKLLILLTVVLLGFGFMRPSEVVQAQPEPICTPAFCGESLPVHNWVNTGYCTPTRNLDGTWESCVHQVAGNRWAQLRVSYTFESMQDVTNLTFNYSGNVWVAAIGFDYCAVQQSGCHSSNVRHIWYNSNDDPDLSTRGLSQERVFRITILLESEPCGVYVCSAESLQRILKLSNVRFCSSSDMFCEEEPDPLVKPLRSVHQTQHHQTHAYANLFVADGSQRPVHAGADGTITRVRDLTPADCVRWGMGERCYLPPNEYWQGGDSDNVQYIVLSTSDIDLEYLVYNASGFVYEGLSVTAGCVIGQTTSLNVTLVYADSDDLIDQFTIEPSISATPCFDDDRECVDEDISFQTFGNVILSNGEYILSAGSSIYTTMALPVDTRVQLRVTARSTEPATLEMQLGTTRRSFNLSMLSSTYTLGYRYFDPDLLDFYSLRITNADSSANIQITDICLAIETIASDYPDHCYFTNYSFDHGIVGWSVAEGVMTGSGELFIPSGQSISQLAELYPDGDDPATYTLEIDIGVWYYNDFALLRSDTINTISISYIYPYIEDDPFQTIDTITFGDIASVNNNIRIATSFDIENQTDGSFVIAVSVETLDDDVRGVSIRRVCIVPDGDEWFGYENPHPTTPIFSEDCTIPHLPQGGFSAEWITWLWGNFSLFFRCDLMQLLNDIYEIARWLQATIVHAFAWTEYYLIPYVAGYFENYSIQLELIVTGIEYTSSAPADWGWE